MPGPTEHKTVQTRLLAYAQETGWTIVPRTEEERRCGFDPPSPRLRRAGAEAFMAEERAIITIFDS